MSTTHASLLALAYATRAEQRAASGDTALALSACLRVTQDFDGQFARAEAVEHDAAAGHPAKSRPTGPTALCLQSSLWPFASVLGPLPEALAADLLPDAAEGARALLDEVYARTVNSWLETTLAMQLPGALVAEGDSPSQTEVAWSRRLSDLLAAGRAASGTKRRLLQVCGKKHPSAADLVQTVGTLWRRAKLPDISIHVDAFAGVVEPLLHEQQFTLGRGRLAETSVLGTTMPAVASCCEVQLGPMAAGTLAALDAHPTFRAELVAMLETVVPATKNVIITLVLASGATKPLRLQSMGSSAGARLGQRSWLVAQPCNAHMQWLNLRAPDGAPCLRSKAKSCM